ncbi:MAG TPA: AAA family ATPase [Microbacterium sp.]|uniref:AAA family ATPase n=1 Tax=Microbacterium sp. TaxID=51671 RepID=UPI002F955207
MASRLHGRVTEIEALTGFVRGESGGGTVLLLSGEPGIGKTALLEVAADVAEDAEIRVLNSTALEYEAALVFGGLSQVAAPLLDHLSELAPVHRAALSVICGLETGRVPEQLIAGAAILALITVGSQAAPLLLVVDDAQWLDRASAMALAYAGRRLPGKDVRLLVAARPNPGGVFERGGFPVHTVEPLADDVADAFLADRFPALSRGARERILDVAQGNPLGLLDLPIGLEDSSGAIPEVLPLTDRLKNLYADRIRDLPAPTRNGLLLMVLAGADGDSRRGVNHPLPVISGSDLQVAERAGIIRTNGSTGRVEFRHPLMRAAVFELSTSDERRSAHAALASALTGDLQRRAWHLGESVTQPSDEIASLLETVSNDLLRAGNAARAISTMLRAAELTPGTPERDRRIARAAYLASSVTGDLHNSARLLLTAQVDPTGPRPLEVVTAAAHRILNGEGDASSAHRLLIAALDTRQGPIDSTDDPAVEALQTLVFVTFYAGKPDFWSDTRRQLERVQPDLPVTLILLDRVFADSARADPTALTLLDSTIDELVFSSDPVHITRIAAAAANVDRIHGTRQALIRVIEDGRRGGAAARAIEALFLLANDDYFAGEWDALEEHTVEGLSLCQQLGYVLTEAPGRYLRALVWAARGLTTRAEGAAEELLLWAAPRGLHTLAVYASHVLCARSLALGDYEDAYRHATSVSAAGRFEAFRPTALWVSFDLVDAAVHTGRLTEAAAHAEAAGQLHIRELSPRLDMLTTAARALVDTDRWAEGFQAALETPGSERFVFDRARIHLAYGERLRRERASSDARVQLATASSIFDRLGARPWLERTHRELRAAGGSSTARNTPLTPQEAAIAELAAGGLTNKDIAAQLYLSPRTVSTHLSRVFAKLDVGTRGALRDALYRVTADLRE